MARKDYRWKSHNWYSQHQLNEPKSCAVGQRSTIKFDKGYVETGGGRSRSIDDLPLTDEEMQLISQLLKDCRGV
tara:strand:+ start:866 stop:1087 length:222 start_codon:yes stop_codon:yes gene_type:complete